MKKSKYIFEKITLCIAGILFLLSTLIGIFLNYTTTVQAIADATGLIYLNSEMATGLMINYSLVYLSEIVIIIISIILLLTAGIHYLGRENK